MTQTFTSFQDFKRRYPIRPNDEGALLGSGSYGRVIKVEDQLETEWVAIKISEFKGNDTKSLRAEVELAKRVPRQANIARYDECYRFETDTSVSDFAIMKYYPDGNLVDLLRRETLIPTQIYDIARGILLGLQHLHKNRIVHRDFKPANILISRDNAGRFIPKIADFGLSKLVSDEELDSSDFDLSDGRGTPSYKAPEQIEGSRVSFNLDLWAFGVILYEVLTGEKPFRADLRNTSEQSARREIEKKIISVELPTRLSQLAEPYGAIIRRCLVRDIHERARKEDELLDLLDRIPQLVVEAQKLLDHERYQEALEVFEQILTRRENNTSAQKGADHCRAVLERQHLATLLHEADALLAQQQFEQAKSKYEQVLQRDPNQTVAIRGLAFCVDRLRPKPLVIEPELTDMYQEESTDVYVVPSKPNILTKPPRQPVVSQPVAVKTPLPSVFLRDEPVVKSRETLPVIGPSRQAFPWRVVAPVVVSIGGLVWYLNVRDTNKPQHSSAQNPVEQQAGIGMAPIPKSKSPESAILPKLAPVPGESKEALTKRINTALGKARQYYQGHDYENVLMLTNSALQLDLTRRDVLALRDAAAEAIQAKSSATTETVPPAMPVPESSKPPEGTEPKVSVEDEKEKLLKAKQQFQDNYDQLIEEGKQAIAKGNNKAKAIANFTAAHSLSREQDLNTAKADAAYTTYLEKANRIFENEEAGGNYEGAKSWYEVAQAVKDTPEVRRKIKQCTNQ